MIPYPATEARVRVDYSFRNEVGLTLLLVPTPASKMNPMSFNMDMTASGNGSDRHWLVSSWTPSGAPAAATVGGGGGGGGGGVLGGTTSPRRTLRGWTRRSARAGSSRRSRSSARSLLVPIVVGVRSWRENRRAVRDYEARRSLDV